MFAFFLFFCISGVFSQFQFREWISDPFNPPSLPLTVKSPYINCWFPQGSIPSQINKLVPLNWDGGSASWNVGIRVDGKAYNLLGAPMTANYTDAIQKSVSFTPTRTSIILTAGTVDVNVTFLDFIDAHDLTHLSMPFTYLYLTVSMNDNHVHKIQFYSDITSDWSFGPESFWGRWAFEDTSDFVYLQMQSLVGEKYHEEGNRAQDSVLYLGMPKHQGLSWEINKESFLRDAFVNGTGLQNQVDDNFNVVLGKAEGLGISVDFGNMNPGTESNFLIYTIGVVRDPVIQYMNGNNQLEGRRAYYWANDSSINDVIYDAIYIFYGNIELSAKFDNELLAAANSISTEYAGLVSLVTRQAMSAIEYTVNINENDNSISDIKAFMKNMGGVGSGQVNAVDVIYAAMPIYLYLNPDIIGYLLSPLLDAQSSSRYTHNYAATDLGGPFPNATGDPQAHNEGIEQSANMIILSLVHAQATGDGDLIYEYYDLLSKWGDYLLDNTLSPADQTTSSSDNIKGTNQTNLILKGIIGIRAMAEISFLMGHSDDAIKYKTKANHYYQSWEALAIVSDRIVLNFGGFDSGLIYNLYADKLLGLNVVNDSVYALQTSFYGNILSQQGYGVPLDTSNSNLSRTDWMLFAASATTDTRVRDNMIKQVYNYAISNSSSDPFPLIYDSSYGVSISGINSPAQGAIFAPLALTFNKTVVTFTHDPRANNSRATERHSSAGSLVGGVIGGVVGITITITCTLLYRRHRQKRTASSSGTGDMAQAHSDIIPTPFRLLTSSAVSAVQDLISFNKVAGSGPDSRNVSTSVPNTGDSTGAGQGDSNREAWREEVNGLRVEIEILREETAPPSYAS